MQWDSGDSRVVYVDVSRRAVIDVTRSSEDSKMMSVDESQWAVHLRGLEHVVGVQGDIQFH